MQMAKSNMLYTTLRRDTRLFIHKCFAGYLSFVEPLLHKSKNGIFRYRGPGLFTPGGLHHFCGSTLLYYKIRKISHIRIDGSKWNEIR